MIPHYRVRLRPSAVKQLKGLPEDVLPRMVTAIDSLAGHTRPTGEKRLEGPDGLYRLRLGGYRVIYQIKDQDGGPEGPQAGHAEAMVLVLAIAHRLDTQP